MREEEEGRLKEEKRRQRNKRVRELTHVCYSSIHWLYLGQIFQKKEAKKRRKVI